MSNKQVLAAGLGVAMAASTGVLARALVEIEHDRNKHIPGVKTGPHAETFVLPEAAFLTLERAGCVERVGVVDTSDVLGDDAGANDGPVVTFADMADQAELERLKAELEKAGIKVRDLADELAEVVEQRNELQALLEQRDAQISELQAQLAQLNPTGTDAAGAGGDGGDGASNTAKANTDKANADADQAEAKTTDKTTTKPAAKSAKAKA